MTKIGSVRKIGGGVLALLLIALTSFAAKPPQVDALVDSDVIGLGDILTLTVSVTTEDDLDVGEPRLPDLGGFSLQGTSSSRAVSSQMQATPQGMVFKTTRTENFIYQLLAEKEGQYQIAPIEVVVDGKAYKTKSLSLSVVKQGQGQPRRGRQGQPPGLPQMPDFTDETDEIDDLYGQLLQRRKQMAEEPQFKSLPKNPNEAFFVTLELDKTSAYEGEQVFANWFIYTRGDILQLDRLKFPDLKGFWKEDVEPAPNLLFQHEIVNGVPYKKALLASYALFPMKVGVSVVDEYKIKATVSLPTSAFGSFGFGQPFNYTRSSERVKVQVKPLPTENKPGDFSGAVGQFQMSAQVEGNNFPTGQPFVLRVRFEGDGNAKLIELPNLQLPDGVELYNSTSEAKFFKSGKSYKEFQVLLIPHQEGDLNIAPISWSYFDPVEGRYVSKKSEPIKVNIVKGSDVPKDQQRISDFESKGQAPKAKVPTLPLPILDGSYSAGFSTPIWFWPTAYMATLFVLLINAILALGLIRRRQDLRDELNKRLKVITSALNKKEHRRVATESLNLMYYILGQLSDLGGSSQEFDRILEALSPSVRRELGDELKKAVEQFQKIAFAPDAIVGDLASESHLKIAVDRLKTLLNKAIGLTKEKVS